MERVLDPLAKKPSALRAHGQTIGFAVMVTRSCGCTVCHLSAVRDAGDVFCAVCLRLQPADRLCRAFVVWSCALFRLGKLSVGLLRQSLGLPAGIGDPDRHCDRSRLRSHRRFARDPPAGHLFRHDHAGAGADDVSSSRCRRNLPVARTASRLCRAVICSALSISGMRWRCTLWCS